MCSKIAESLYDRIDGLSVGGDSAAEYPCRQHYQCLEDRKYSTDCNAKDPEGKEDKPDKGVEKKSQ